MAFCTGKPRFGMAGMVKMHIRRQGRAALPLQQLPGINGRIGISCRVQGEQTFIIWQDMEVAIQTHRCSRQPGSSTLLCATVTS